jgi:hypothetical protein
MLKLGKLAAKSILKAPVSNASKMIGDKIRPPWRERGEKCPIGPFAGRLPKRITH